MRAGSELLNRRLSSEAKAQLLLLFHKNPGLIDTIDGVARRIGRTINAIHSQEKRKLLVGHLSNRSKRK